MKKVKSTKHGLKALNDVYIIEEDAMTQYDGKMIIPDAYEYYAKKFPCTGKIVALGDKTRYGLKPGDHVVYGRLGVMRYEIEGKAYCDVRECDLHAILI